MDNYQVLHLIGEGCFGKVFKGRRKYTGEAVALKFISTRGKSDKDLKNLRQEMAILKDLNHENIILLLDAFETASDFVVVTEYAHGELFEIFQDDRQLPESEVQKIAKQLVHALYYLHSNRVIHRDMKPQNILIGSNNVIKLCDFGFARSMSNQTVVLNSVKGTPLYMAPELVQEKPYNHTADIWSLGVILYELVVGTPPFYTNSLYSLINLIINDSVKYPDSLSRDFRSFLQGLLQKNPAHRLSWPQLLHHPFINTPAAVAPTVLSAGSVTPTSILTPRNCETMFSRMEEQNPSDELVGLALVTIESAARRTLSETTLRQLELVVNFLLPLMDQNNLEISKKLKAKSFQICNSLVLIVQALPNVGKMSIACLTLLNAWLRWDRPIPRIDSIGALFLGSTRSILATDAACLCLTEMLQASSLDPESLKSLAKTLTSIPCTPATADTLWALQKVFPIPAPFLGPIAENLAKLATPPSVDLLLSMKPLPPTVGPAIEASWSLWKTKLDSMSVLTLLTRAAEAKLNASWNTPELVTDMVHAIFANFSFISVRFLVALLKSSDKRDVPGMVGAEFHKFVCSQATNSTNEANVDGVLLFLALVDDDSNFVEIVRHHTFSEATGEIAKRLDQFGFSDLVGFLQNDELVGPVLAELTLRTEKSSVSSSRDCESLVNVLLKLMTGPHSDACVDLLALVVVSPEASVAFVSQNGLSLLKATTPSVLTIISNLARCSPDFYPPLQAQLPLEKFLSACLVSASTTAKTCNTIGNLSRHNDFFYPHLAPLVGRLISTLNNRDVNCRKFASFALGNLAFHSAKLYPELAEAVVPLVSLLADSDEKTRANAAGALGNLVRNSDLLVGTMIKGGAVEALLANATKRSASGRIALFSLGNLAMHAPSKTLLRSLGAEQLARSAAAHARKIGDTQTVKYCERLDQKMTQG